MTFVSPPNVCQSLLYSAANFDTRLAEKRNVIIQYTYVRLVLPVEDSPGNDYQLDPTGSGE